LPPIQRYFAFLRAINVGGHTVKMEQLRALFSALGFANVTTYIASGNVIFETATTDTQALESQIERQLQDALGYEVLTFIRTAGELAAIADYIPFAPVDQQVHGLYVSFVKAPLSPAVQQKLLALRTATDDFHVHGCEFYWLCRTRLSDSPLFSSTLLGKTMGVPSTMRNSTTVKKLAAKYVRAQ
jgi:uncharacterized protein (DUF1697 family)